jgi:SAM-dependent MidA family methyltransferase
MTALADLLIRRITATGPISVADYMADCLLHPEYGYYSTRDPFGTKGDFTTAPEISQMFGEMLGLCLAQSWMDQGAPASFTLAELGPGRGTLMADVLRATKSVAGFRDAAQVHLVEASPVLRARQRDTLRDTPVTWHDTAATLPDAPLFLLANEFFDALPIRQFVRTGGAWRERQVGVKDGALCFGLGSPAPVAALMHRLGDTANGDLVEVCPAAPAIMVQIGTRIAAYGGVALIVDYGGWNSLGDTLQALKSHAPDDPLAHPGQADLTAHVDFAALARYAEPAIYTAMTAQGVLLERLGITARAQSLARHLDGASLSGHIEAHRRLTHPDEMGTLFQAIGIHPKGTPPPAGFDT